MTSDNDDEPEPLSSPDSADARTAAWVETMIAAAERAGYRLHPDSDPPHTLLWQRATDEPTADPIWVDDLPSWLR
ncbi:hypothetical protein [Nocardia terpenica]|uniref:Uncharacterized protein n=1 Tax=Nocardia terpenica TaxID=455432 RepID=A0A6G9YZZ7_9NOCA|nr:hypothetical protein [Nocardia terpenica]MBF6064657.1 hypothetical protein [Nocardia terpenica]MBF6106719.1 hypothetical protein [Nocardia terpenica]MBF6114625.1 hypothetical protein [Nocardia terpenica]MBF6121289.1 hypothetical protein [Nocardia terpenica]MBF6153704.1 hypothetical protein [Nocardia terpenica]